MLTCLQATHGFIGAGSAGSALATALAGAGHVVAAVHSRSAQRTERLARLVGARPTVTANEVLQLCDTVWLTVPDDRISAVCDDLPWTPGHRAIHCSGVGSLDLLSTARTLGAGIAVFHPLQSFAQPDFGKTNLEGSFVGIEASSEPLASELADLASSLGAKPDELPPDRVAYHASAVLASNALVALLDLASGLWEDLGRSKMDGLAALLPLVRGTVENLSLVGLPDALTGPVSRGDLGTIERHRERLHDASPELRTAYDTLSRAAISIALAKGGIDERAAEQLRRLLQKETR